MPTVYYPQIDLIRLDVNGARVAVASTTVDVYNVTAAASEGTVSSDANGVIAEGTKTADVGDVIELSVAGEPEVQRLTLQETQEQAYTKNHVATYVVENLYTPLELASVVQIWGQDTDNPDTAPVLLGQGRRGETVQIPQQTNITKNLRLFPRAVTPNSLPMTSDFSISANYEDVEIPAPTPGAGNGESLWDHYADRTTTATTEQTLHIGIVEAGKLLNDGDKIVGIYSGASASNANEKEWHLKFNGTDICNQLIEANVADWSIEFDVMRESSSSVRCSTRFMHSIGAGDYVKSDDATVSGLSLDDTLYEITMTAITPSAAGDITLKMAHAEKIDAAPWTPSNISSAVMRLHHSTLITDALISTWKDIIRGQYNATSSGTARPTTVMQDGQNYASFDGTTDYMSTSLGTAFGDFAVFMVIRPQSLASGSKRFVDKKYDDGFYFGTHTSSANQMGGGIIESGSPYGDHYAAVAGTWYAVLMQRNGTVKTIRFGGVSDDETVSSTALSTANLIIGADQAVANFGQFDMKELVVCSNNLSADELTKLIAYSLSEYGLTL